MLDEFNRKRAAPFQLPDREIFAIMAESRRLAAELIGRNPGGDCTHHQHRLRLEPGGSLASAPSRRYRAGERPGVSRQCLSLDAAQGQRRHARARAHDADGWPDESRLLDRLSDPRVRVLAVSLVQFSNGYTIDLARLSAATRASGTYLVVDAIQGVGQLPVDVAKTPVDILACGAQKWLLSPWGSGFVYVRRELVRRAEPVDDRMDGL